MALSAKDASIRSARFGKIMLGRTCNKCSHTQSVTSNTLFHKVKFRLGNAFFICFEMAKTTKGLSASYTWVFRRKVNTLFRFKVNSFDDDF